MGWGITKVGQNFFDTEVVQKSVRKAARKALSKAGAFIRQRAKTSIRKRKKSSPPGQPPSSHEGSLRRLIFFAFDPGTNSVVVGPLPFRKNEAGRLLEHGGVATRRRKDGTTRKLAYKGNPFMAPAARAEMPKFSDLLRGMVR